MWVKKRKDQKYPFSYFDIETWPSPFFEMFNAVIPKIKTREEQHYPFRFYNPHAWPSPFFGIFNIVMILLIILFWNINFTNLIVGYIPGTLYCIFWFVEVLYDHLLRDANDEKRENEFRERLKKKASESTKKDKKIDEEDTKK
jgi:hypothetical protein